MSIPVYLVEHEPPKLYSPSELTAAVSLSPASRCNLEYLNEGGANFVFRILPPSGHDLAPTLRGRLLRLRKNLPHNPTAEEQLDALNANFRDLFPSENLIQHDIIALARGVLKALNANIQHANRPKHREGDWLPTRDMSGLLVTDMTSSAGETLLQLKPKWLTQSPNAPPGARRCRTCAVRAQRASERIRTATDAQESCPLGLINEDVEQRRLAVHAITTDDRLREFLLMSAQPLLHQLRASQILFDPNGALQTSDSDAVYSLCKAMTLRDCTLFVKQSGNSIEARLGDLDFKPPEKLARWKRVESRLINEGWYTNTEDQEHWVQESICLLSRG